MQRSLFVLLLVEDNPAEVGLLKEALKRSPVPVQLCPVSDGTEALAFLYHADRYNAAPCPDLIVLDLNCGNLPELNGQAVLARLKTDVTLKQIPVVVFTSSTKPEDIAQSYALGANAYVQKPMELAEFFVLVDELIGFWCLHDAALSSV
jgi:chemotaxis family two-component system response regulator Rcp1